MGTWAHAGAVSSVNATNNLESDMKESYPYTARKMQARAECFSLLVLEEAGADAMIESGGLAGAYCLDAPLLIPAGSTTLIPFFQRPEPSLIQRGY